MIVLEIAVAARGGLWQNMSCPRLGGFLLLVTLAGLTTVSISYGPTYPSVVSVEARSTGVENEQNFVDFPRPTFF